MAKKVVKDEKLEKEFVESEVSEEKDNSVNSDIDAENSCDGESLTETEEDLRAEIERLKNYSLRMKADIENMKKRNQNIASEMYRDGKMETLCAVLPVADSLDRALALDMDEKVKEGIDKIKKQFEAIIEKLGIEEINAEGEPFDPNLHNALMQIEDKENSGKCVQVYEKGYKLGDKVLRHASVVVAK